MPELALRLIALRLVAGCRSRRTGTPPTASGAAALALARSRRALNLEGQQETQKPKDQWPLAASAKRVTPAYHSL